MRDERLVWAGRPSQWLNAKPFTGAICFFLVALVLQGSGFINTLFQEYLTDFAGLKPLFKTVLFLFPLVWIGWKWLLVYTHNYELTDEVFREHYGVFNRVTHELELYRVIDTLTYKPFELNMMGLGNVVLNTSDASDPVAYILAVRQPDELRRVVRNYVEAQRTRKGIVEVANR